jgi:hypothetical protein
MRDLVSHAALGTPGRWKVYIVDEVHMLSTAASNALLKTLEEPPGHVVFVLATTDAQKVLPTIRSRTQHFEFRLLGSETLSALLHQVRTATGLALPDEALDAAVESMWTSSTMYTFHRPGVPRAACDTRSRMASTPLFDAASSSWTSSDEPRAISTQESQRPQGSPSSSAAQFNALARIRAVEVLPVPRGPLKRYACPTRPSRTAFLRARLTCSCPSTSSKRCGRKRRYRDW